MASSPPTASQGVEKKAEKDRGQVMFRFCSECSNMLYPKEDEATRTLKFTCRTCQYTEEAKSWCVYRNNVSTTAMETAGVTQDVASDPTLPRAQRPCPKCEHPEAVFFQSQQRNENTGMKLFYVCCGCGHKFQ
jgi:DNA-directed RNA polymerase II subunit RPB9